MEVSGGTPKDSLIYAKTEKSIFINNILYRSSGTLKTRVDFGADQNSEAASDTFSPNFDFSDEFQANGSYILEKIYCKQRAKRNLIFVDLASSNVQKGSLEATIDSGKQLIEYFVLSNINCILIIIAKFDQYRMRKIRSSIPSIPGLLEDLRRNPNNTELGIVTYVASQLAT